MPFRKPGNLYLDWFHAWSRLESRSRHDDFAQGLQAGTADGYWMLGRQIQMKELKGEDAGTPVHVTLRSAEVGLGSIRLGPTGSWDSVTEPMEVLVEREYVKWDWRLRVRAGQHFERLLTPHLSSLQLTTLRTNTCTIVVPTATDEWHTMDLATRRFVQLMAGRAIDGKRLLDGIDSPPLSNVITDAAVIAAIKAWFTTLYSHVPGTASPAWQPERLDYEFSIRARPPAAAPLHAGSYRNGAIDWHTFETTGVNTLVGGGASNQLTPTHAMFAGQPRRRWWEFEDHAVNFGELNTATTDLGKLVLMEYALVFGDDWFVIPLRATPNSMVSVLELKVRDCFGQETPIPRAVDASPNDWQRWEVFALSSRSPGGANSPYIYVPPIIGIREESPVLEEVRFARDEGANCIFAIEQKVPNQLGEPVDGFAAHLEAQRRWRQRPQTETTPEDTGLTTIDAATGSTAPEVEVPEDTGSTVASPPLDPPQLAFVLGTRVPRNWIPFIATDQNAGTTAPRKVKLRRAEIVSLEPEDAQLAIPAQSRLLTDGEVRVDWLDEEAVGRAGARVELRRQRIRTADGKTYVWLGRKVGVGKGEVRSGLRYDVVKDVGATST